MSEPSPANSPENRRWTRRQILAAAAGGIVLGAVGTGFYANRIEPHWVEIVRRNLQVVGLPPEMDGKTLLQLSDLHIGPIVDDGYLISSLQRAAALEPDIVVHTGDLIHSADDWEQVEKVLAYFPKGQSATLSILGNHDYGPRWANARAGDSATAVLRGTGVDVLRDSSVEIDGLRITGLEEKLGPYWRPDRAAGVIRDDRPHIVLCHNPDACDDDLWNRGGGKDEYRGWILSGHTHGGQVRVPFLGPPILPTVNKRYTSGEFDVGGGRRL